MTPQEELYREIPLTKGQVAIVDAEDYERLTTIKWQAKWCDCVKGFYAARSEGWKPRVTVRLHRVIMGLLPGDGKSVDHINGNTLDNRKINLRLATHTQNMWNRGPQHNCKSGYRGVYWRNDAKKWRAVISFNGKKINLGHFLTKDEACLAYRAAQIKYHGEFAKLT